jgi:hypothetical protein
MILRTLVLSLTLAAPSHAQTLAQGSTVTLRGLDRIAGETSEINIAVGSQSDYGRLRIGLRECRFPADNPAADAFAFLEIEDTRSGERMFSGWMIASAPGLNALDHVRYDVWVIGCQ